jgi:hypothetical protein
MARYASRNVFGLRTIGYKCSELEHPEPDLSGI